MSDEQPLSQLIKIALKNNNLSAGMDEAKAIAAWHKIVGPYASSQTDKVCLRGKVMYVNIANGMLRQELLYQRSKICYALNGELGQHAVQKIIIK